MIMTDGGCDLVDVIMTETGQNSRLCLLLLVSSAAIVLNEDHISLGPTLRPDGTTQLVS